MVYEGGSYACYPCLDSSFDGVLLLFVDTGGMKADWWVLTCEEDCDVIAEFRAALVATDRLDALLDVGLVEVLELLDKCNDLGGVLALDVSGVDESCGEVCTEEGSSVTTTGGRGDRSLVVDGDGLSWTEGLDACALFLRRTMSFA